MLVVPAYQAYTADVGAFVDDVLYDKGRGQSVTVSGAC